VVPIPSLQRLFDRSSVLGFLGALWARRTFVSVPRLTSPFIVALRERGPTVIHSRRPRSGRVSDRETDPEICPEEITFLTFSSLISTSYLYLDNPLIYKSVHRAHCIMTVSYVLSDTMTTIHLSVSKQILV
jgi:hypothetical protein